MLKISLILSFALIAGCAGTEVKKEAPKSATKIEKKPIAVMMNEAQVKKLLVGNTMVGDGWTVLFSADGTASLESARGPDTGTYTLKDGVYCSQWKKRGAGKPRCWSFGKGENDYFGKPITGNVKPFRFTMK